MENYHSNLMNIINLIHVIQFLLFIDNNIPDMDNVVDMSLELELVAILLNQSNKRKWVLHVWPQPFVVTEDVLHIQRKIKNKFNVIANHTCVHQIIYSNTIRYRLHVHRLAEVC